MNQAARYIFRAFQARLYQTAAGTISDRKRQTSSHSALRRVELQLNIKPRLGQGRVSRRQPDSSAFVIKNKANEIQQQLGPLAYVSNMEAVFVLISSGRFLGALPNHYAKAWVESGELRLLCADSFSWVSKFYLANRPESARRRAVDLFIQDILQTINDTRSKVTSVSVSRLPVH